MSLKLLKQSVEIIEEDLQKSPFKKGKQTAANNNGKDKTSRNPPEKHILKKDKKRLQDVRHELNNTNRKAEETVKRLLALSMNTVDVKDAEKIVARAHKGRYVEKIVPKIKQESIFTEEDFRKFEEEYFNS